MSHCKKVLFKKRRQKNRRGTNWEPFFLNSLDSISTLWISKFFLGIVENMWPDKGCEGLWRVVKGCVCCGIPENSIRQAFLIPVPLSDLLSIAPPAEPKIVAAALEKIYVKSGDDRDHGANGVTTSTSYCLLPSCTLLSPRFHAFTLFPASFPVFSHYRLSGCRLRHHPREHGSIKLAITGSFAGQICAGRVLLPLWASFVLPKSLSQLTWTVRYVGLLGKLVASVLH